MHFHQFLALSYAFATVGSNNPPVDIEFLQQPNTIYDGIYNNAYGLIDRKIWIFGGKNGGNDLSNILYFDLDTLTINDTGATLSDTFAIWGDTSTVANNHIFLVQKKVLRFIHLIQ